ncbi:MAG: hypothetical protein V1736_09185 [Pseudomonadota bacterium]
MGTFFQKAIRIGLAGFVSIWFCSSCSYLPGQKKEEPVETKKPEPMHVHTVKWSGETVSIIAGWYTGSIENWKALAEANPNLRPDRICVGNKILIPESLMKTHEPMPEEYLWNFMPRSRRETPKTTPKPEQEEEEPKLFGPKDFPSKKTR